MDRIEKDVPNSLTSIEKLSLLNNKPTDIIDKGLKVALKWNQ